MSTDAYREMVVQDTGRNRAVADFVRTLSGPGIVFVRHKEHVDILSGMLGCPGVTSDVPRRDREGLASRMKAGGYAGPVVATAVWTTGLNIPSLRWVALAGEGEAPAGLKQAVGRGSRTADGKDGYDVYNFCTVGSDVDSRYEEQALRRADHLARAGFSVEQFRSLGATGGTTRREPEPPPPSWGEVNRRLTGDSKHALIFGFVVMVIGLIVELCKN